MKAYFNVVKAVVWKDMLLERRSWERLVATITFALMIAILFHFAFDIQGGEENRFFPGAVWIAMFFAGTVGMTRTAHLDDVDGRGRALFLAPVDRSALFVGSFVTNIMLLVVTQLIAVPLFIAAFSLSAIASPAMLLGGLALGTWGFAALGTLLSGAAGGDRSLGLILPLLLFPLLVPVALGAVELMTAGVTGDVTPITGTWLRLLVIFNVLFTVLPALFYEYIVEV